MYRIIFILTVFIVFIMNFIIPANSFAQQEEQREMSSEKMLRAKILHIKEITPKVPKWQQRSGQPDQFIEATRLVDVQIIGGEFDGQVLHVRHEEIENTPFNIHIEEGDQVLIWAIVEDGKIANAYIADYARDRYLKFLVGAFILLLAVMGGKKGVKAIITLALTALAIIYILLPLMLKGYNPIALTVLISAAVTVVTFIIIGGLTRKTLTAVVGTVVGVIIAGLLAYYIGTLVQLSGISDEDAQMLMYIPQSIDFDFKGLLFAGMMIGALGAVMDVGISIASAMDEIKKANPQLGAISLAKSGMNVGRDIMGTMANTLILAYTGGAIPMLLLFMAYDTPALKIINMEFIATEIVRAMAGSIGLILAVPVTAVVGGVLLGQQKLSFNKSEKKH